MNNLEHLTLGKTLAKRFTLLHQFKPHVLLAQDHQLNCKVVLKKVQEQQLKREWNCMMQCTSPSIIKPLAYLPSLLVLPYIEGQSLLTFDQQQASLFIDLMPKIIQAIQDVHRSGWVHGDIKPSNFLYTAELHSITLIDFGAAMPINTLRSALDEWQLTPEFSNIDRQKGIGIITPEDDWYALDRWLAQVGKADLSSIDKRQQLHFTQWLDSRF